MILSTPVEVLTHGWEKEGLGGGDPRSGLGGYRCAAVIPWIPRGLSVFTS